MYVPFLLSLCISLAIGLPPYQDEIPNGHTVPDPCGGIWEQVGHNTKHPVHNNPNVGLFGADFRLMSHQWGKVLCKMDSDKDGKTNGVELGDPHCTWTKGGTPSGPATGHPGLDENTYSC